MFTSCLLGLTSPTAESRFCIVHDFFFFVRFQLQSLLMHAVMPLSISDPCPEIIGHLPCVLHFKIWAFQQDHLDFVSLKEDIGQNYHTDVSRPQL